MAEGNWVDGAGCCGCWPPPIFPEEGEEGDSVRKGLGFLDAQDEEEVTSAMDIN